MSYGTGFGKRVYGAAAVLLSLSPASESSAQDLYAWPKNLAMREGCVSSGTPAFTNGRLRLVLQGTYSTGPGAQILLCVRSGEIINGYGTLAEALANPLDVDYDLTLSGASVKGTLAFRFTPLALSQVTFNYTIDATVSGSTVSGTYTGKRVTRYGTTFVAVPATGAIGGDALPWAETVTQAMQLADGADWPGWNGPATNFLSPPNGPELVSTMDLARFVWRSEEVIPTPPGNGISVGGGPSTAWQLRFGGGGATPVIKDNLLYVSYFYPSGDRFDTAVLATLATQYRELEAQFGAEWLAIEKMRWAIEADDVVLCLDARTGSVVWKKIFAGKGLNYPDHKGAPENHTPCVANGKLYAVGSSARVYCMDALTGELKWESRLGRTVCGTRDFNAAPIVIDGVVVILDYAGSLVGFDGETGAKLWSVGGFDMSPLDQTVASRWMHGGKEYAIALGLGKVVCVTPSTGSLPWTITDAGFEGSGVTVAGDYLLVRDNADNTHKTTTGLSYVCYRMSLTGVEKLWTTASPAYEGTMSVLPPITNGHVYLVGSTEVRCVSLATGATVSSATGQGGTNSGLVWMAGDRLFIAPDGKHGESRMVMWDATPRAVKQMGGIWIPPHPNSTSYHQPMAFPLVDGRLYIRGDDGIYCYDMRRDVPSSEIAARRGPAQLRAALVPARTSPGVFDLRGRLRASRNVNGRGIGGPVRLVVTDGSRSVRLEDLR